MEPTTYSASSIVDAYLGLLSLAPNPDNWSTLTQESHPSAYFRFKQLTALFRAFGLPLDYEGFRNGRFLHGCNPRTFGLLGKDIAAYLRGRSNNKNEPVYQVSSGDAVFVFQEFFRLQQSMHELQRFNSGWLEASPVGARYAIATTNDIIHSLAHHPSLQVIKTTLSCLIDPHKRLFLRLTLVREYAFPDVDLLEIDIDNW